MSFKTELQANNTDLQAILDTVNDLPSASEGGTVTSGTLKLMTSAGNGTFQYNYNDNMLTIYGTIQQGLWASGTAEWSFNACPLCYEDGTTMLPTDFFPSIIPPSEGTMIVPGCGVGVNCTPSSAYLSVGGNYIVMNWGYWNPGTSDTTTTITINITLFGTITG